MTRHVHSFDVYDTCLTRTYIRPADLFFDLALRTLNKGGISSPSPEEVHEVVRLRLEAERAARRACAAEDLSLPDIYAWFSPENPFGIGPLDLMRRELELEETSTRRVESAAHLVDKARCSGARIIFVSDMYLPGNFVRGLLEQHGLALPEDGVYVSGDIGLVKTSGRLFRHVLEQEGIAGSRMMHVGDNPRSDVAAARKLGIRARLFPAAVPNHGERLFMASIDECKPGESQLAGAARLARLRPGDTSPLDPMRVLAAGVAAPLITSFAAFVLEQAREAGAEKVHFVSRDGYIPWKVAQILAPALDGPEPLYLFGSRQAWFLPSILTGAPEEMDWLVVEGHSRSPYDILAKLQIAPQEIAALCHAPEESDSFWTAQCTKEGLERLRAILALPPVRDLVRAKAVQARELLLDYLFQERALETDTLHLADIGWTLKTQRALKACLRAGGKSVTPFGFYFALSMGRLPASPDLPHKAMVLERAIGEHPGTLGHVLFRNANCIEQVFTKAGHGQVTGYARENGIVSPLLRGTGAGQDKGLEELVETSVAFAKELASHGNLRQNLGTLRRLALATLQDFLTDPGKKMAQAVAASRIGDDQNESRLRPLAKPLGLFDLALAYLTKKGLAKPRYEKSFDWIEGSVALSPRWLRPLLQRPGIFELLRYYRKSL